MSEIDNIYRGKKIKSSEKTKILGEVNYIEIKDKKLVTTSRYEIKGMRYKVNSIFDLENVRDSEEGLKRLMVSDANKAS